MTKFITGVVIGIVITQLTPALLFMFALTTIGLLAATLIISS